MENKIKKYETYLRSQELAEGTIKIYVRFAKQIEKFIQKAGASKQTVLDFKQELKERRVSPATFNLAIISVNKYLKFSGYGECVVKTQKIQKRRSLENVISADEYRKMLQAAQKGRRRKYYYIMKTLAATGIRVSELQYFTVEILQKKKIVVNNKGKTREIYLPDGLIQELEEYCASAKIKSGVIFKGSTEKPIGRASVYKATEKVSPHRFRHLIAVTYKNRYGNLTELADNLGHSNLETTRIYTLSTAEEKRNRMDHLGL